MSGRFKKAPLVYVSARINTTPVPQLLPDQKALLQQAMMKCGLVINVESNAQAINLDQQIGGNPSFTPIQRLAFFSQDRSQCLLIDKDAIEWRVTTYNKYADFIQSFENNVEALLKAVDFLGHLACHEFILSYADIIAPQNNHNLNDYFKNADSILPLSYYKAHSSSDVKQVGHSQVTRVTRPDQKITISLEQLPIEENKIKKLLPEPLMEPDQKLGMPLEIRDEWRSPTSGDYGLLMTQAGILEKVSIDKMSFESTFGDNHKLTKETFNSLLNFEVCNQDWEYEDTRSTH